MSEGFFTRALSLAVRLVVLIIAVLFSLQLGFFYIIYNHVLFYGGFLLLLYLSYLYGTKLYADYMHFRGLISEGLMFPQDKKPVETLNLNPDEFRDQGVKACLLYHQGYPSKEIAKIMQLSSDGRSYRKQVQRLLRRGLEVLICQYEQPVEFNIPIKDFNDAGLKACSLYNQGTPYRTIAEILHIEPYHPFKVTRYIKRGLKILMKDYQTHNGAYTSIKTTNDNSRQITQPHAN